ncbi:hypothetical protein FACS1894182_06320 [Bacteroidia bacterium]|nr:hypothetical protein FACS1894182_06320 [Bacteroidia bacterium]
MFERNLAVRIFMFIMFGFLALEFLAMGFALDKLLLETKTYTLAIDVFNSIILYVLLADFAFKFFFKQNQSMQIAPYLTLPVKHNKLFNFLLFKEFGSFWNWYWLFLVVPFALKSITPFYGAGTAFLYILFFYLLCITVSLLVNLINFLITKSYWFYILPVLLVAIPIAAPLLFKIPLGDYTQHAGDWLLNNNPLVWIGLIAFLAGLWLWNRILMRTIIYSELQGEKGEKISSVSSLSFLDRFGSIGDFMNLEIKMILRSKRLKQQTVVVALLCFLFFVVQLYIPNNMYQRSGGSGIFVMYLYCILTLGTLGLIMGQYIFTSESSFFDGLMARRSSIFDLLKSKYILYFSYSLFVTLLLLIPAIQGKISILFLLSAFFYTVGPIYFIIFQNAVYNKTHFDLFDKGMMNWKGQSGNMIAITMITMFVPVILILIVNALWGQTTVCLFMLITGLTFTLTVKYWLTGIYKRFSKRRYKNMEGFRTI